MFVQSASVSRDPDPATGHMVPREVMAPFILVTSLFFLWGLPNNLNDVLIRQFMKSFELTRFQAGLIQSAFYLGYFVLATPAALLMTVRLQDGDGDGTLPIGNGNNFFLARGASGSLLVLSARFVCHRQRSVIS
jgi:hypothetical protein